MLRQPAAIQALADTYANAHAMEAEALRMKTEAREALLATGRTFFACSDGATLSVINQKRSGWNMEAVKAILAKVRGLDIETLKTQTDFQTLRISRPTLAQDDAAQA